MAAIKEQWFSQTGGGDRVKAIGIHRNKANTKKAKINKWAGLKEVKERRVTKHFLVLVTVIMSISDVSMSL